MIIILTMLDILCFYKWYYWKKQYKEERYYRKLYELRIEELNRRGVKKWNY